MTQIVKTNWPSLALILLTTCLGFSMSHNLPEQIPVHFNAAHSMHAVAKLNFAIAAFLMVIYLAALREALEL